MIPGSMSNTDAEPGFTNTYVVVVPGLRTVEPGTTNTYDLVVPGST